MPSFFTGNEESCLRVERRHRVSYQHSSSVGLFGIVCVTDRLSKAPLQLAAVQDNLLRMYRLDCREWDNEFPRILHVDHKFGPAVRRNRPNRSELLTAV